MRDLMLKIDCPHCFGSDLYLLEINQKSEWHNLKCHWSDCEKRFKVKTNVVVSETSGTED